MTMRQIEAGQLDGVRGRVVLPDDAGWDAARRSWNLSVDQRPAAVVEAADAEDVQAVLRAGPGALAGEVAAAAGEHGLAALLGLAPTVGVTGLALGGGTGWLSRMHGL